MRLSTGCPREPGLGRAPPNEAIREPEHGSALPRSFYAEDVVTVARACLGKVLVARSPQGVTAGVIVETEAYRGPEDLAAHSARGRRTPRTEAMFGPPGYAYVFLVYGMHFQFNLVTGSPEEPHAVLIRAVEPLLGCRELMSVRRGVEASRRELTNGPGKLCQAFGIDRSHYGADLCARDRIFLTAGPAPEKIGRSPRVGVDYAGKWAARPWRFFDAGSRYVSVGRSAGKRSS
jgi:DNA-3-methyladenine glycosylase